MRLEEHNTVSPITSRSKLSHAIDCTHSLATLSPQLLQYTFELPLFSCYRTWNLDFVVFVLLNLFCVAMHLDVLTQTYLTMGFLARNDTVSLQLHNLYDEFTPLFIFLPLLSSLAVLLARGRLVTRLLLRPKMSCSGNILLITACKLPVSHNYQENILNIYFIVLIIEWHLNSA